MHQRTARCYDRCACTFMKVPRPPGGAAPDSTGLRHTSKGLWRLPAWPAALQAYLSRPDQLSFSHLLRGVVVPLPLQY